MWVAVFNFSLSDTLWAGNRQKIGFLPKKKLNFVSFLSGWGTMWCGWPHRGPFTSFFRSHHRFRLLIVWWKLKEKRFYFIYFYFYIYFLVKLLFSSSKMIFQNDVLLMMFLVLSMEVMMWREWSQTEGMPYVICTQA